MGALFVRTLTAVVALPAVFCLIWIPSLHIGFSLFIALLAGVGLFEYYSIVRSRQISPETIGGIVSGTLVVLSSHLNNPLVTDVTLDGGSLMVAALHIVRGQRSVAGLASSLFGIFYVGWLGSHITRLRCVPELGPGLVTILLVAVSLSDSAAYVFGSLFGKHKLAPKVSPGKTWEGAVAGFAATLAGMAIVWRLQIRFGWVALPDWSLVRYLAVGAVLSVTGQIGDLMESCLKRDAGVKDSGAFFPGHGGVLDRCDGFLFAAPIMYYMAVPLFAS